MSTLMMHATAAWVQLTMKRGSVTAADARRTIDQPKPSVSAPAKLAARHDVSVQTDGGFSCWTVAPRGHAAKRAAVFLHGGAYISEIAPQHWALAGKLAEAGVQVEVPLYGLAPQHDYREAYAFVAGVYQRLLPSFDPGDIAVAGDSAGGGLALGFAQTLIQASLPQPGQVTLIAPWLDLTLTNPDLPAAEARDPWLSSAFLREAGRAWAGGDDPADPRLSPVNGPLAGLAPISVWIGTRDLFYPDAVRLQQRAQAEGAQLRLTVCPGAIHVYPLLPAPEGRTAANEIVREIAA